MKQLTSIRNSGVETFKRLQKEIEEAKTQANILRGRLLSLSSQLKKYGFKNIKDARKRQSKLKEGLQKEENKFNKLIIQFENKYFKERN